MDDQNPELGGASEGAEDLKLELEADPPKEEKPKEPSGDPLDDIKDPAARAEAKKYRAIARREEKKTDEPAPEAKASPEYVTKEDLYKANERKAIRIATTANPDVKANWDKILPFYAPRYGRETPEDIAEAINDAYVLYRTKNPVVEKDDSATELTATPVVKAGGGPVEKDTPKPKDPPNFKLPVQPT